MSVQSINTVRYSTLQTCFCGYIRRHSVAQRAQTLALWHEARHRHWQTDMDFGVVSWKKAVHAKGSPVVQLANTLGSRKCWRKTFKLKPVFAMAGQWPYPSTGKITTNLVKRNNLGLRCTALWPQESARRTTRYDQNPMVWIRPDKPVALIGLRYSLNSQRSNEAFFFLTRNALPPDLT